MRAFARGLKKPRGLFVLPNGDVLVSEAERKSIEPLNRPKQLMVGLVMQRAHAKVTAPNRLLLLRDSNGDGAVDETHPFIEHLNAPSGITLVGGDLYVATSDAVTRYPYTEGDTRMTAPGTKLAPLPEGPINHHWTKSLTASPDGSKLYAGVGSNSNVAENGMDAEQNRAAILEIDRASGAFRVFASGIRNPNGLNFEPTTGALWAVVNERDELGPDLVPDYMTSVKDGGFYGWPYSYYGKHLDPRVMPQRPDLVKTAIVPDYALGSHVAPLGMVFNTGTLLPDEYQGGAFIAEHGSWNRSVFNGYKVVFIAFRDGQPVGMPKDILTGFLADGEARGRPVNVAIDKQGALLVADDGGGVIWRVTAASP